MSQSVSELITGTLAGNNNSLARLITLIEQESPEVDQIFRMLSGQPRGCSPALGYQLGSVGAESFVRRNRRSRGAQDSDAGTAVRSLVSAG